jgi:hypothetical protein
MFLGSFEDIVADLPGPLAEPSRLVDNQTGRVRDLREGQPWEGTLVASH